MKYSSSLLKKFISINDTPENIAKNLILKTCEIEEVHKRTLADSIVIGKVTSCEKHPDADKLKVCKVDCGSKGEYQIVCGGTNVATGLYVPVALPGTHFAKAGMTIEPREMRGIASNGMICSKEELEINEDTEKHEIRSLQADFEDILSEDLGKPLKEKYSWLESWILEVDNKSLTNRPDLTGHFGIATELQAIYHGAGSLKLEAGSPMIGFNKVKEYHEQCTPENIMQILENSTKSERKVIGESVGLNTYLLLDIKNTDVRQTSFFSRLQSLDLGSNPINNRVDFSNLFMLISGQPIHFFDADKVEGDIIVRNAKEGEKFIDLFNAEHNLKENDIVISDKKKILALAGVIGGLESGITESTKNILVEIANFDAVAVRKTGTRLGLRTDAELRFEKNINPRRTLFCLTLFLDELKYYKKDLGDFDIGGLSYFISEKIKEEKSKHIEIDSKAMEQSIFGKKIKGFDKKLENILTGLGFTGGKDGEFKIQNLKFKIICPLWRSPNDLNIQEDIYEEVARIYGYDQIENVPLLSPSAYVPYTGYVELQRKIEDILVKVIGCNQTEGYPRVSEKTLQEFAKDKKDFYSIQNPVNPEAPYMRDDMIYGLLPFTAKNSKFFESFKIFDIGKIRKKHGTLNVENGELQVNTDKKFASEFVDEQAQVGVMLYQKNIDQRDKDPLLEAKNIVRAIAKELELGDIIFEKSSIPQFHPKKQANLVIKSIKSKVKSQRPEGLDGLSTKVGFIGALHPGVLQNQKIGETSGVVYISLNISTLVKNIKNTGKHSYTYETLQDQIVWRDLCFVIESNKSFESIINTVREVPEIQEVTVFDLYTGSNLGENKKSISIKLKIVGDATKIGGDGNMTTDYINAIMDKAIKAGENAGGSLRA